MNVFGMLTKVNPRTMSKVNQLCEMAAQNETLVDLCQRLDGCDAREAYEVLSNLTDYELRVLAALIGEFNRKFDRCKGVVRR